jgi:hypothetical protein
MSPRAAWRLESLGFTEVYHYVPGEADWFAFGLPMEGARAEEPRAGQLARQDVPRCGLSEKVGAVRDRVQIAGWDICVVVNEETVVLGLLRERELAADPDATVERVMRSGPATYRPDALVAGVAERLEERDSGGSGHPAGWTTRRLAAPRRCNSGGGRGGEPHPERDCYLGGPSVRRVAHGGPKVSSGDSRAAIALHSRSTERIRRERATTGGQIVEPHYLPR